MLSPDIYIGGYVENLSKYNNLIKKGIQPYYSAYLVSEDEINKPFENNSKFVSWIMDRHREFRNETGIERSDVYRDEFLKWLIDNYIKNPRVKEVNHS